MANGKFETPKKRRFPLHWLLLVLVVMSLSAGSVTAYLSMSAGPAQSTLSLAQMPTVTVEGGSVTITSPDCEVYLRVAVVANTTDSGSIKAGTSEYVRSYTGWTKINDMIYEYNNSLAPGTYSLSEQLGLNIPDNATVAAQVIQAVGTIDNGDQSAKANAWNWSPAIP